VDVVATNRPVVILTLNRKLGPTILVLIFVTKIP
jgi:hypothetical protein